MRKYLEIAHIWQDGILPRRDEAILTDLYSQGFYKTDPMRRNPSPGPLRRSRVTEGKL